MIRSQPVTHESGKENGEVMPVWASVPAQGAPSVSKEERGSLLIVNSKDLSISEGRMGLDLTVILFEREQQEWAFETELKAAEALQARKGVPLTVKETCFLFLKGEGYVK